MVVGLLDNESPDSNRLTLVTPKSENDVRLQATLGNQNPTGLPVGAVSAITIKSILVTIEESVNEQIKFNRIIQIVDTIMASTTLTKYLNDAFLLLLPKFINKRIYCKLRQPHTR